MFNLTVGDNKDKKIYIKGIKECYSKDIVYGEVSQFQFDYLRDKYSKLDTLAGTNCDIAIVDEVDSMLIDESSKIARLSTTVAGMDHFQFVYFCIWNELNDLKEKILTINGRTYLVFGNLSSIEGKLTLEYASDNKEMYKRIDDLIAYIENPTNDLSKICQEIKIEIEDYLKKNLSHYLDLLFKRKKFQIPVNFFEYFNKQKLKWINNAIEASTYEEKKHYIIQDGQIKPVDFNNTGVVQNSTNWSDGLHQFLQIKHNLKMTCESFTTNFLSNVGYFNYSFKKIFGLTGTLGSPKARQVIQQVYNVDLINIPEQRKRQFLQLPSCILENERDWLNTIHMAAMLEVKKKRSTLIICETIAHADRIAEKIKSKYRSSAVKLYTMNNLNQEKQIEKTVSGDIIIATNLAGRGTNIQTNEIEKHGGLHVILTFMPNNQRVEDQAFGRTARQGQLGTGELILNVMSLKQFEFISNEHNSKVKKMTLFDKIKSVKMFFSSYSCFKSGKDIDLDALNWKNSVLISHNEIAKQRDKIESNNLDDFQKNQLPLIVLKDKLFSKFCHFLNKSIRTKIREQEKNILTEIRNQFSTPTQSVYETNLLAAIEEKWSMFLKKIDDKELNIKNAQKKYDKLIQAIEKDFNKGTVIKNPYHHTAIGFDRLINESLFNNKYDEAIINFEKAIKLDENISAAAYAGLAWALVNSKKGLISDKYEKNYKLDAIKNNEKAISILTDEMARLNLMQTILQEKKSNFSNSDLYKQLYIKTSILGSYINSLKNVINSIKCSLRLISITQKKEEKTILINNLLRLSNSNVKSIDNNESPNLDIKSDYSLEFNDLTRRKDGGRSNDQASITIINSEIDKNSKKLFLKLKPTQGSRIKEFFNENVELIEVTKEVALNKCDQIDGTYSSKKLASKILNFDKKSKNFVSDKIDSVNYFFNFPKTAILKYYDKESRNIPIESNGNLKTIKDSIKNLKNTDNLRFDLLIKNANKKLIELKKTVNFTDDIKIDIEFLQLDCETIERKLKELSEIKSVNLKIYANASDIIQNLQSNQIQKIEIYEKEDINIKVLKKDICYLKSLDTKPTIVKLDSIDYKKIKQIIIDFKILDNIYFDIEFINVKLDHFLPILDETQIMVNFEFIKTDKIHYESLIKMIRDLNLEFSVEFKNLKHSHLIKIIQNASLDQEDMMINKKKNLSELFMKDSTPELELAEYAAKGIEYIIEINEKNFVPWRSICIVSILASVQIVVGSLLIVTGFGATIGMGLISEGISDLLIAYRAYATREFSWQDYCKQKAVSLMISVICSGVNIKDLGKAGKNLFGTSKNVINSGANLVNASNKLVSESVKQTTQNLSSVTTKYCVVKFGEAVARETLNKSFTYLTNMSFDIIRPILSESIQASVKRKFYSLKKLIETLRKMYAIEVVSKSNKLQGRINKIISDVINPEKNYMQKQWNTIGEPLMKGILSEKYGSPFSFAVRIWGTLQGLHEMHSLTDKVFEELYKKLTEIDRNSMTMVIILSENLKIDKNKAANIASKLKEDQILDENDCFSVNTITNILNINYLDQEVKNFLGDFNKNYSELTMESIEFSMIMKTISDKLSDQVIRIIEGKLISPWSSLAVSSLVDNLSNTIQNNYLVNENENSDSQNKDIEKFRQLVKDKENGKNLTKEEETFMHAFRKNTFAKQIQYNAKDKALAITQCEIKYLAETERKNNNKKTPNLVKIEANRVKNGKPAGIAEQAILSRQNGLNTKIIQNENYQMTEEDTRNGVQLILIKFGELDQPGHAYILGADGRWESVKSDYNDCIYAAYQKIIEKKNGKIKSIEQLRSEVAGGIENNSNYLKVLAGENWIRKRYPNEKNELLFTGAGQKRKTTEKNSDESDWVNKIIF
jgi:preprotein translocase subunit SecA